MDRNLKGWRLKLGVSLVANPEAFAVDHVWERLRLNAAAGGARRSRGGPMTVDKVGIGVAALRRVRWSGAWARVPMSVSC